MLDWQTLLGLAVLGVAAALWFAPSLKLPTLGAATSTIKVTIPDAHDTPSDARQDAANACRACLLDAYRIAVEKADFKTAEAVNRILCGEAKVA